MKPEKEKLKEALKKVPTSYLVSELESRENYDARCFFINLTVFEFTGQNYKNKKGEQENERDMAICMMLENYKIPKKTVSEFYDLEMEKINKIPLEIKAILHRDNLYAGNYLSILDIISEKLGKFSRMEK
jgi:hypothetical protein